MLYAQESIAHDADIHVWDALPEAVRVKGRYTLDDIERILSDEENGLPTIGIPVEFSRDQIQRGSLFNKQFEDCLVLKNAEHPNDYFHFVFTTRTVGAVTTCSIYRSGISPRSQKANKKDHYKNSSSFFENVLGALTQTDEMGIEEEYDYYAMVADIIKEMFHI